MRKKHYTRYTYAHLYRRNLRFWLIYAGLVVLIVLGLGQVYRYFDANLKAYEAAQYTYRAEEVASIFTQRRFDELYRYENSDIEYLETEEDYVKYLNTLTEGKLISYKQVSSKDYNEVCFVVYADEAAFARFTLRKTGEAQHFEVIPLVGYTIGADIYALKEISTDVLQPVTYDYTIPASASITVNGRPLPESTVVKTGEPMFYEGHLPAGFPTDTLTSYRFTTALGTPEVIVRDAQGEELTLTDMGQDTYRYEFPYSDEEMKPQYEEYGVKFVQLLCRYTTDNCKLSTLLRCVQDGSTAYNAINQIDTKWRTSASSYEFRDISTRAYARYSDTLYSCEVSLIYHGVFKNKVNDYPTNVRVFFTKQNSDWLVYDFSYINE